MTDLMLRTKLFRPNFPRHFVPRPNLLSRLDHGLRGPLTLVSAPAGFGKSTLVSAWFDQIEQSAEWQITWLALDEADNVSTRFFSYFVTAIQQADKGIGQTAKQMLHAPQSPELTHTLAVLLNDLATTAHKIVLALDEYHFITDETIHAGIRYLLDSAPPNFHLVLIGRADPPFSLARLRSHGQMTEIRQHDLRFANAEAATFLNESMALALAPNAVNTLVTRTEGWAAGLHMAAMSLQGRVDHDSFIAEFSGSNRYVFDFLAEEVLARTTAEIRSFLLQTSILNHFCADLCDAILPDDQTGRPPSATVLAELETTNHFLIPLDDERRWYRYHNLFADLLRQLLRQEMPERKAEVHLRASQWFDEAGLEENAIQHALAAESEKAIDLVARYSASWLDRGELNQILTWLRRLPPTWRHNPQLLVTYAWAQIFRGSVSEVEAVLADLPDHAPSSAYKLILRSTMALRQFDLTQAIALSEEAMSLLTDVEPDPTTVRNQAAAQLNLAHAYRHQGASDQALQYFAEAVTLSQRIGNVLAHLNGRRGWGETLIEVGRPHEAEPVFVQGVDAAQGLSTGAPLYVSLGRLYYQWNRLDEAEPYLEKGVELLKAGGIANRCDGLLALVRLRLAQERPDAIPAITEELESLRSVAKTEHAQRHVQIALAEVSLAQHVTTPQPQHLLEHCLSEIRRYAPESHTVARLLCALGRPSEACPILERMRTEHRYDRRLAAMVALCACYQALGDEREAQLLLSEVLTSAQPTGYLRVFLDVGESIHLLLTQIAKQDGSFPYAAVVLAAYPAPFTPDLSASTPFSSPTSTASPLTARETEVLRLIAQGFTNKEIAAELVIAPSTAKRHTVNVYNKLGVSNRAEATAQAYELALV